jgi:4-phosphopantoate--beta-alanine ligase
VVLIPLEDGDRAEALRAWGRDVIAIDLNPLARTSRVASVTLVDELTRALPAIGAAVEGQATLDDDGLEAIKGDFDNTANLQRVLERISGRLLSMGASTLTEGDD